MLWFLAKVTDCLVLTPALFAGQQAVYAVVSATDKNEDNKDYKVQECQFLLFKWVIPMHHKKGNAHGNCCRNSAYACF